MYIYGNYLSLQINMGKRYAPAVQIDPVKTRLMYVLVKLLWLLPGTVDGASPGSRNKQIERLYMRVEQRILENPCLSKLNIPLPKINAKVVSTTIRQQEKRSNLLATQQPKVLQHLYYEFVTYMIPIFKCIIIAFILYTVYLCYLLLVCDICVLPCIYILY